MLALLFLRFWMIFPYELLLPHPVGRLNFQIKTKKFHHDGRSHRRRTAYGKEQQAGFSVSTTLSSISFKCSFRSRTAPTRSPSPDLNYGRNYIATGSAKNISELFTSQITVRKKKTYFHNFFSFTVNTEMKFTP